MTNGKATLASAQVLTIPFVGITDVPSFDPASDHDANGSLLMSMLYSGLVRLDQKLQVQPDQASWTISSDQKVYTFHLDPAVAFADGTPVTARSYIDSWLRVLQPSDPSTQLSPYMGLIEGAQKVHAGQAKQLSGVRALDEHTLQIKLTQPASYFLAALAKPLFFPINTKMLASYQNQTWPITIAEQGIGSGPFIVKNLTPAVSMTLIPNPFYYRQKPTLTQLKIVFTNDARVAYIADRVSHYDLVWGLTQADQQPASQLKGFMRTELLQTDALFFNVTQAPFDSLAVRQVFAASLDKHAYATTDLGDSVATADTLFPPALPGYQAGKPDFNPARARELLKSAPARQLSNITFSYPTSLVTAKTALALQTMWHSSLGIHVNLRPLGDDAYQQALKDHAIQFGITSLQADIADPSAFASSFLSNSPQNMTQWQDASYDQLIEHANATTVDERLSLYQRAEQKLLASDAVIPLDHQRIAGLIPSWIEGVSLNANGIYFDWPAVKILAHS
ncbi:peptide ABC transporter substrate-binding protein [Dictyobacter arantiisoli]|uniref:peptide ABC transporter substrate-binding protein n=1 Tax=Dictyobacter arantiisoli TaxID=2014874 RepID=UPI00155B3C82|nr:peptide ABC transporter substrate-binding protein [Dictyobacter arantiisoli]